jgi:TetR/AcrR family transcriptional regulator, cholesterol catabolism regulator
MSTDRERASQKKKAKIIHATMQLLLKRGSTSATSTTDICTAARMTRPSLYHYFGSKKNLLLAVHVESLGETLKPYLQEATSITDPLQRLSFMVSTFTKEVICRHPELRILIHDSLSMKSRYFKDVREVFKEHYVLLRDTIAQLQSEGKADKTVKSSWDALFVLGMSTWVTYWFDYSRKDKVDELAAEAVRFVFKGLGIDEPSI